MFASHNHKGRRDRDHMVVGFLTTYTISDSGTWRGVLCDPSLIKLSATIELIYC
jgi:hypothetical protein